MLNKQNLFGLFVGLGISSLGYAVSLISESGFHLLVIGLGLTAYACVSLVPASILPTPALRKAEVSNNIDSLTR